MPVLLLPDRLQAAMTLVLDELCPVPPVRDSAELEGPEGPALEYLRVDPPEGRRGESLPGLKCAAGDAARGFVPLRHEQRRSPSRTVRVPRKRRRQVRPGGR